MQATFTTSSTTDAMAANNDFDPNAPGVITADKLGDPLNTIATPEALTVCAASGRTKSFVLKGAVPSGNASAVSESSASPDTQTIQGVSVTNTDDGLTAGAAGTVAISFSGAVHSGSKNTEAFTRGGSTVIGGAGGRATPLTVRSGGSAVIGGGGGRATPLTVRSGGRQSSCRASDDWVATTTIVRGVAVEASSDDYVFGLAVAVGAGAVGAAGATGATPAAVMTEADVGQNTTVDGGFVDVVGGVLVISIEGATGAQIGSGTSVEAGGGRSGTSVGAGGGVGIGATGDRPVKRDRVRRGGRRGPGAVAVITDSNHQGAAVGGTAFILQAPGRISVT
jgi:hypothetical protein